MRTTTLLLLGFGVGCVLSAAISAIGLGVVPPQPLEQEQVSSSPQGATPGANTAAREVTAERSSEATAQRSVSEETVKDIDSSDASDDLDERLLLRRAISQGRVSLEPHTPAQWKQLWQVYVDQGAVDEYRRVVDAVPVRPLGISYRHYRENSMHIRFVESLASLRHRLSNRVVEHSLRNGEFTFFSIPCMSENLVFLGNNRPGLALNARHLIRGTLSMWGQKGLPENRMKAATNLAEEYLRDHARTGYRLWHAVAESIQSGRFVRIQGTVYGKSLTTDRSITVVQTGSDSELGQLLGHANSLAETLRLDLRALFED